MLISMLISISINIFMLILTSIKLINKINGLISCLVSVSFVIFGHKTWDLEGGGQIDPPPAYPGFQVPQQG